MDPKAQNKENASQFFLAPPLPEMVNVSMGVASVSDEAKAPMIAPAPVEIVEPVREIAYVVKDKHFGEFEVVKTANAWWADREKVDRLIVAFKNFMTVEQASNHAGITPWQWRYFSETHPDFSRVKAVCKSLTGMKAKVKMVELIEKGDGPTVRWFMEKTEPEEFGSAQPLAPIQNNNFGIVVNNMIPVSKVKPALLEKLKVIESKNGEQPPATK